MKLHLINQYLERYGQYLGRETATERLFIWESQRIFQERWDLDATDLPAMYASSLDNTESRRLWNREHYEPKRAMLEFLGEQPDFIRGMFRELFDERKSMDGRCARFSYYCDQLLEAHREERPKSPLPDHYHGEDYRMISLYLAFRYPANYAPYEFDLFRQLLEAFEAPKIPQANDLPRYFKLMGTLRQLILKNEVVVRRHRQRLDPDKHFMEETLLLAYDFSCFVVEARSRGTSESHLTRRPRNTG